jgi:Homoserine kinase
MSHNKIKISSVGIIANFGLGFDSIGAAIDVWNDFEFEFDTDSLKIVANGEGTSIIQIENSNLVY